jgi:hypothetical protein
MEQVTQAIQQAMGNGGGGMGGGGGGLKPKIDINVEMVKNNKLLARIADTLGVKVDIADMMTPTADELGAVAAGQPQEGGGAGPGAGGPEGGGASAIQPPAPIDPMAAATPAPPKTASDRINNGKGFPTDGFEQNLNHAEAIAAIQRRG